ncbi:MAG: hypothetical protein ACLUZX_13250 [Subdoligranulum sp.]|uniref:hypothetical protein n=1 Tax=Gemmiger sp. TaxID=2049027 RepID=UPI00343983DD
MSWTKPTSVWAAKSRAASRGCPIQTNIPEVIRLLKANKLDEAGRKAGIVRCCLKDRG